MIYMYIVAGSIVLGFIIVFIYDKFNPPDEEIEEEHHEPIIRDRITNLTNTQNEVLDIYRMSNIKIPVEIIEDLDYYNITDKKEVFEFIESQRYSWKLENGKKPIRKVK